MEKRNGGRSMNSYKVAGMKIGIVPKYNPITQKEYCSVPAVLQMIQERRGLRLFTQDLIGHHLGLVVPADKAHLYRIVRTGMEPETGWGTQIYKSEYSINAYFGRAGLPLKFQTHHARTIDDVSEFLAENLTKDNDVGVCFNGRLLYGHGDVEHLSLIQEFEPGSDEITVVDPGIGLPKLRKVRLSRLLQILEKSKTNSLHGFWVFSSME
jgi:hypothetical protein